MRDDNSLVLALIIGGGIIFIALVVMLRRWEREAKELEARAAAEIVEMVALTGLGRLCAGLLLIWNLLAIGAISRAGSTVFQEVAMALFWIGGNLLLGLGIVVGRRRRFLVRQKYALTVAPPPRPAMPDPPSQSAATDR